MFLYDNQTAVVHSFRDEPVDVKLVTAKGKGMKDILSGETLKGDDIPGFWGQPSTEKTFGLNVKPHSYRVIRID